MSACVIWIDSQHAKLFKISASGIVSHELKKHSHKHSNSHQDSHKHQEEEHFFCEVAQAASKPEELLIFGPGVAKSHFKNHIEKHNQSDLAKVLVGVEPLDHLSDNQILEASRKFFKKFNQFNVSI